MTMSLRIRSGDPGLQKEPSVGVGGTYCILRVRLLIILIFYLTELIGKPLG